MWDLSSQTRDRTHSPSIGSTESSPLDHQGSSILTTLDWNVKGTREEAAALPNLEVKASHLSLLSSPSTPTLGRPASWQGSSEHCPSAPAPHGAVWPQGAETEGKKELRSPGVRLPECLIPPLPGSRGSGAFCACFLATQWDSSSVPSGGTAGQGGLRHSKGLARSEPSVNGNGAETGRGTLCEYPLAASEDELDLEPKLYQSLCFSEVRFRRSLNSMSFLLFYR